jgi:hypothetical protein
VCACRLLCLHRCSCSALDVYRWKLKRRLPAPCPVRNGARPGQPATHLLSRTPTRPIRPQPCPCPLSRRHSVPCMPSRGRCAGRLGMPLRLSTRGAAGRALPSRAALHAPCDAHGFSRHARPSRTSVDRGPPHRANRVPGPSLLPLSPTGESSRRGSPPWVRRRRRRRGRASVALQTAGLDRGRGSALQKATGRRQRNRCHANAHAGNRDAQLASCARHFPVRPSRTRWRGGVARTSA